MRGQQQKVRGTNKKKMGKGAKIPPKIKDYVEKTKETRV